MGISIWQLLIVLVIIVLLFGTKKLSNIGSDLGSAIKSFRSSIREGNEEEMTKETTAASTAKLEEVPPSQRRVIEGEVVGKKTGES